jgi:glyoxylase-like metal-dependent hydrolase (beta-lactamase superfamily II)
MDRNLVNNGVMARHNQTIHSDSGVATLLATVPWQHEKPVPLLKNVMRLTAPNPGMMTGPGTNSYLIGTADTGYIVVDPGPNDAAHIQRLFEATQGDIQMIVCTHSHADHSPGAKPLQALCPSHPQIYGLPSGVHASSNSYFAPDKTLQNKEQLRLISRRLEADLTTTIEVIFTPGHAENHVCLALVEDGLLLSGDHILNGSTTVINPPDGHMGDYLDSLDVLTAACAEHQIQHILPAHGYVLEHAVRVIAHLKAHRLGREEKISGVMQTHPTGTLDDWVAKAYDDVSPHLWPVAKRSLLAHVEHIRSLNPASL